MRSQFDDNGQHPDVSEVMEQLSRRFRQNFGRLGPIIALVLLGIVLYFSFYTVSAGEQAVVQTFGRETSKQGPGLHFRLPWAQEYTLVNVEQIRRIEVGFRGAQRVVDEAQMLTGDENIVEAQLIVQYRVTDPSKYLFRLADSENSLRATAEVALRSTVGKTTIDDAFTTGRERVQDETWKWLQKLMDDYQSGLSITEVKLQTVDAPDAVKEAFHDVVRAREEKEKVINQARGYQADLIPKARGEARTIQRDAEAYREQRVLRAQGDADKFNSVLIQYRSAESVTRERLYLETLERIFAKIERKIVIDEALAKGALPVLPLGGADVVGGLTGAGRKP
jgi:modulator of FtsH protease HflK